MQKKTLGSQAPSIAPTDTARAPGTSRVTAAATASASRPPASPGSTDTTTQRPPTAPLEVRVLDPSDLVLIPAQVLRDVGDSWPTLYRNLFRANWVNVRGLYEILDALLFYPLKARVAGRVLVLIGEHGHKVDEGILLDIKLSQNDFARLAMGSRQRVNGIFRDWDRQGLVETRGEYLLIKDIEGLQREMTPFE